MKSTALMQKMHCGVHRWNRSTTQLGGYLRIARWNIRRSIGKMLLDAEIWSS
ncbi:hypothetical protein F441_20278 [Phytophthora nicotianae CJ01A1]|uniref:Uncharacterized protein n=3 Tax=Phytophthora nicotianae TaxID=4792 RepID=W2QTX7_PHYN3|nr:hypothetical protein PPTG_21741 [Phytophthora nicotianae INRA-310]ETI32848.1 hypothetical protein F443_20398 [Phytophthora nicotianae P1569]ETN16548.1 hypothetical protein PPTG_21741 [Phytophthora nicotianae INRA-310]ETP02687.1 hypothetical protein F441_20278 [Phytophthora nicotianae CJ01A1]